MDNQQMPSAPKQKNKNTVSSCFEGEGVVKEFHIDVDAYVDFYAGRFLRDSIFCGWCTLYLHVLCEGPCLRANLKDKASAIHLAVTKTHVVYCRERHKTCWRCKEVDEAKYTKKIPLQRIADVVIYEPAGDCCPPNALYTVTVQTAAKSDLGPEISVTGISKADAYEFRRLALDRRPSVMQRT